MLPIPKSLSMKIRTKKIKAFTISEMIVALLITTIVIGMSFSVLNLVQRQMSGIENNYEYNTRLNLLRQTLWIDFNTHELVRYDDKAATLTFYNELSTVQYQIDESFVVKQKDTFQIQWTGQRFFFEHLEVESGEIDALQFDTGQEHGNQGIFVYKNNSATTYMNQ